MQSVFMQFSMLARSLVSVVKCGYIAIPLILAGLSLVPGLVPPSEVQSSNPALTGATRYNLNTGATFNISCSSTHTSNAFTVSFYKDGVEISDGDLVNTTLTETVPSPTQKFIFVQFHNFQPLNDGVYHCFANTSDTNDEVSSDLYIYGSGEDCMVVNVGGAFIDVIKCMSVSHLVRRLTEIYIRKLWLLKHNALCCCHGKIQLSSLTWAWASYNNVLCFVRTN